MHEVFEKPEDFIKLNDHIIKDGYARNFEATLVNKHGKAISYINLFAVIPKICYNHV